MNTDTDMRLLRDFVLAASRKQGLECECLAAYYTYLCAGESPGSAASMSLDDWDIETSIVT